MADGDRITIDIPRRDLALDVPEADLAARRDKLLAELHTYRPADRDRPVSAALQAYAAMTTSAAQGAARDVSLLGAPLAEAFGGSGGAAVSSGSGVSGGSGGQ